ncbi:MAG: 2-dehydropantoate 2-reductase, partial [Dehalococcoidia bacterium]|nr:2-dehydropantoate 2-reductase [Dehalococcoidia bacterium]
ESEVAADINEALWNKLVYICGLSGMTCITRSSFKEVVATPQTADLTLMVMEEAATVGRAAGVNLANDVAETTMAHLYEERDGLVSSMHADLNGGRPLELANLNGKVSELGHELGVPTPMNDFITACLTPAHNRAVSGT